MMELTTLANGLRVVTRTMPSVETVAVGLYADTGSRFETAHENGIAHLVEHMVFKGTRSRSARAIAEAVEDVGGSLNAYTARDATVFHARMLARDLPLGLEIITDLIRDPRFDDEELVREKQVVLQELGEARDTPDDIIFDHLQEAAYPDQPLGRSILGDEASVNALDAGALRRWIDTQFCPETLVIAAAGKVDHDRLVRQAEGLWSDLAPRARPHPAPARYLGGRQADDRRFEQAHLTLAYEAPATLDPDHYAVRLFAEAAGGGMSSRLFQELREERGLAYSIYATTQSFTDSGLFTVYCATARRDAAKAMALTREVLARAADGLEPAELERARAQAKAGLLMSLESCQGQADYIARQLVVHGGLIKPAEVIAALDAVTLDQVRAVAGRLLSGPAASASVGIALSEAA